MKVTESAEALASCGSVRQHLSEKLLLSRRATLRCQVAPGLCAVGERPQHHAKAEDIRANVEARRLAREHLLHIRRTIHPPVAIAPVAIGVLMKMATILYRAKAGK